MQLVRNVLRRPPYDKKIIKCSLSLQQLLLPLMLIKPGRLGTRHLVHDVYTPHKVRFGGESLRGLCFCIRCGVEFGGLAANSPSPAIACAQCPHVSQDWEVDSRGRLERWRAAISQACWSMLVPPLYCTCRTLLLVVLVVVLLLLLLRLLLLLPLPLPLLPLPLLPLPLPLPPPLLLLHHLLTGKLQASAGRQTHTSDPAAEGCWTAHAWKHVEAHD